MKLEEKQITAIDGEMTFATHRDKLEQAVRWTAAGLAGNYGGDSYVCDCISEAADYNVPIFNGDLIEAAWDLEEYVGEAIENGFISTDPKAFSLARLMQGAWHLFIEDRIYDNLAAILYNFCVNFLNDNVKEGFEEGEKLDGLKAELEAAAENADSNSMYSELEEACALAYARIYKGIDISTLINPVKEIFPVDTD